MSTRNQQAKAFSFWVRARGKPRSTGLSGAVNGAKVHLGCDVDTLQIRARDHHVEGDSLVAAELLAQKPSHATAACFMGDGAYETQYVHEACHRRGAITIIPPAALGQYCALACVLPAQTEPAQARQEAFAAAHQASLGGSLNTEPGLEL